MVCFASVGLFVTGAVALAVPRIVLPSEPWGNRVLSVVADAKCGPIGATSTYLISQKPRMRED